MFSRTEKSSVPSTSPTRTVREELALILGQEGLQEFEADAQKWPERKILDTLGPPASAEIVAWVWARLANTGLPILSQLKILSELFPHTSFENKALRTLHLGIKEGEPLFGDETLLPWEQSPTLAPLAQHLRKLSVDERVKDFEVCLRSYCPWAKGYQAAIELIEEWRRVNKYSDAHDKE